jgi:hypothetical protein
VNFYPANWIDKHTIDVIELLGLRAPEVILGSGWGPSAEIWGLGCVVRSFYFLKERAAEMHQDLVSSIRNPNFAAEHNITEEQEVLLQMTMLFGDVPMSLINVGTRGKEFYSNTGTNLFLRIFKFLTSFQASCLES